MNEYRYKINKNDGTEIASPTSFEPKVIGEAYRIVKRQYLDPGESVELQKREIPPWTTVEKETRNE